MLFFTPDRAGVQDLGQFVTTLLKYWTVFSAKANMHASTYYYRDAMTKMRAFIECYENPSQSFDTALNTEAQQIM